MDSSMPNVEAVESNVEAVESFSALPTPGITGLTSTVVGRDSWLALQLACGIALGYQGEWLDMEATGEPQAPAKVVIATHNETKLIGERVNLLSNSFKWIKDGRSQVGENIRVVDMSDKGPIWAISDSYTCFLPEWDSLVETCEDASLLILEPVGKFFVYDGVSESLLDRFDAEIGSWSELSKCAVLLVGQLPAPLSFVSPASPINPPNIGRDEWRLEMSWGRRVEEKYDMLLTQHHRRPGTLRSEMLPGDFPDSKYKLRHSPMGYFDRV